MVSNFLHGMGPLLAAQGAAGQGNMTQMLVMFGFVALFFYFVLLRPERKRRKALETMRNAMKKGDKVTAMGILGTIDKVGDKTVVLKMVDGAKIEVLKETISQIHDETKAKSKGCCQVVDKEEVVALEKKEVEVSSD